VPWIFILILSQSKETPSEKLGSNLRRIFIERGSDFFEQRDNPHKTNDQSKPVNEGETDTESDDPVPKTMTVEELYMMRMEILPQLL